MSGAGAADGKDASLQSLLSAASRLEGGGGLLPACRPLHSVYPGGLPPAPGGVSGGVMHDRGTSTLPMPSHPSATVPPSLLHGGVAGLGGLAGAAGWTAGMMTAPPAMTSMAASLATTHMTSAPTALAANITSVPAYFAGGVGGAGAGGVAVPSSSAAAAAGGKVPTVGLLPVVSLDAAQPKDGAKPRRAARTNLDNFTAEEKLERRKEKARLYSAIARKRQESSMKDLKLQVDSLSVYRLLIEEGPDMITVLSPDVEARILFANDACSRMVGVEPTALTNRSLWDLVHPEDKPAVLKVLSETILAKGTLGKVPCRLQATTEAGGSSYLRFAVTMRFGPQGIIAFVRPQGELAAASAAAASASS